MVRGRNLSEKKREMERRTDNYKYANTRAGSKGEEAALEIG